MSDQPPEPTPADEAARLLWESGAAHVVSVLMAHWQDDTALPALPALPALVVLANGALTPAERFDATPLLVQHLRELADDMESIVAAPDGVPPEWGG